MARRAPPRPAAGPLREAHPGRLAGVPGALRRARRRRRSALERAKRAPRVARSAASILNRWARGTACRRALRGQRERISALKLRPSVATPVDRSTRRRFGIWKRPCCRGAGAGRRSALLGISWRWSRAVRRAAPERRRPRSGRSGSRRRDAKALQARLREAQALGLGNLPPIRAAADDLDRVHREERLARDLDAFVADPLRAGEDVPAAGRGGGLGAGWRAGGPAPRMRGSRARSRRDGGCAQPARRVMTRPRPKR